MKRALSRPSVSEDNRTVCAPVIPSVEVLTVMSIDPSVKDDLDGQVVRMMIHLSLSPVLEDNRVLCSGSLVPPVGVGGDVDHRSVR